MNARELVAHPNIVAFLHVIREGESNQTNDAYRLRYPGVLFDDLSQHPNVRVWLPNGDYTTAAGAYQFTYSTWKRLVYKLTLTDFSPQSQDIACVELLIETHAVEPLLAGNLELAIARCRMTWTSLPGAAENHRVTLQKARDVFVQWGGTLGTPEPPLTAPDAPAPVVAPAEPAAPEADPAPQPELTAFAAPKESPPMFPLIAALLPSIIEQIPALMGVFGNKDSEVAQRNQAAAQIVADTVVKATNSINLQEATEKIQSDDEARAKAQAAVLAEPAIASLLEAGSGGIDGARKAASDPNGLPFWRNGAFWMASAAILLVAFVIVWVLTHDGDSNTKTQVVQAAIGFATTAFAFWLGSSFGSQRKDERKP